MLSRVQDLVKIMENNQNNYQYKYDYDVDDIDTNKTENNKYKNNKNKNNQYDLIYCYSCKLKNEKVFPITGSIFNQGNFRSVIILFYLLSCY